MPLEVNLPAAPSVDITPDLFDQFIRWIDRSPTTTKTYLKCMKRFFNYMTDEGIKRPDRSDVLAYRDMLTSKYKANTVALYLRSLQQFFRWTAAEGIYPNVAENVHAPKIDRGTHKKDSLDPKDIQRIEFAILGMNCTEEQKKRLYAMFELALNAGMRTVELSRANIGDIESRGEQAWIMIWGKGHSEADQKKPIAPEVMEAITDYLNVRTDRPTGNSPLFVATGNRSGGKRIASTTISTMLKRALQTAGYNSDRLTAHSLRHTTGTAVQAITGDLLQTQRYLRHSDPATTEIYLHDQDDRKEIVTANQLYDYLHADSVKTD